MMLPLLLFMNVVSTILSISAILLQNRTINQFITTKIRRLRTSRESKPDDDDDKAATKEEEKHCDRSDDDKAAIKEEEKHCDRSTQTVDLEGDLNEWCMYSDDGDEVGGKKNIRDKDRMHNIDETSGREFEECDTNTWRGIDLSAEQESTHEILSPRNCITDNAREQRWCEERKDDMGQNSNTEGSLDVKADVVPLDIDRVSNIDYPNNTDVTGDYPGNLNTTISICQLQKVHTEEYETCELISFQETPEFSPVTRHIVYGPSVNRIILQNEFVLRRQEFEYFVDPSRFGCVERYIRANNEPPTRCLTLNNRNEVVEETQDGSENLDTLISICLFKKVYTDACDTCNLTSFHVRVHDGHRITTWTFYGLSTSTGYVIAVSVFKVETPEYMAVTRHIVYGSSDYRILFQNAFVLRRQELNYFGDQSRFGFAERSMRAMYEPPTRCLLTVNYTFDMTTPYYLRIARPLPAGRREDVITIQQMGRLAEENTQLTTPHGFPVQCIMSPLIEPAYFYTETESHYMINGVVSNHEHDQPTILQVPNQTPVLTDTVTSEKEFNREIIDDGDERTEQQTDIRQNDVSPFNTDLTERPDEIMHSGNIIRIDFEVADKEHGVFIEQLHQQMNSYTHFEARVENQANTNDSVNVPFVDDDASIYVQIGNDNFSDEGYDSLSSEYSSIESTDSDKGKESLDREADMINDRYVAYVPEIPLEKGVTKESSKFTKRQHTDDTILNISLDVSSKNPNEGRINIYRKNAGSRKESITIQIGLNNTFASNELGKWIRQEFAYQVIPKGSKAIKRWNAGRMEYTYFVIRVIPSEQLLYKIKKRISGTLFKESHVDSGLMLKPFRMNKTNTQSCTSSVGILNGSSFTDHMNHPVLSSDAKTDGHKGGLPNNSRCVGIDNTAEDNRAEKSIEEQSMYDKGQIMCTGETHFDSFRCQDYTTEGSRRPGIKMVYTNEEKNLSSPQETTSAFWSNTILSTIPNNIVLNTHFEQDNSDNSDNSEQTCPEKVKEIHNRRFSRTNRSIRKFQSQVYASNRHMKSGLYICYHCRTKRKGMLRLNSKTFPSNSEEICNTGLNTVPFEIMDRKKDYDMVDRQTHVPLYKRRYAACNPKHDKGVCYKKRMRAFPHKVCQKNPDKQTFTMECLFGDKYQRSLVTDVAALSNTSKQDHNIFEESNVQIRTHSNKRQCHVDALDLRRQVAAKPNRHDGSQTICLSNGNASLSSSTHKGQDQVTKFSHLNNEDNTGEIQNMRYENIGMGDTTTCGTDCSSQKINAIGNGQLLNVTDHEQLVEAIRDRRFATGEKMKLMPEPENSFEDERTTHNRDQECRMHIRMIEESIKRTISSSLKDIPLEVYTNLMESFEFEFHRLSDDGIVCQMHDSNGSERNLMNMQSVLKIFIREKLSSLEVYPGIFLQDVNDIEVYIVK